MSGLPEGGHLIDAATVAAEAATGGQPMVKAEQVWKSFGKLEVLKGVDFVVQPQQTFVLLGPSGGGKSTLLRCINHLEKIDAGRLYVAGELMGYKERGKVLHEMKARDVARQRASIGMVFQRFNLFPHKTAIENVMEAPIKVQHVPRKQAEAEAEALLRSVGLGEKLDTYPAQLSGGQQQRVAIARALINEPSILLADEPTGNLDTRTSIEVMGIFQRLNKERGITVMVITHEMDIAEYGTRFIRFRDGKVVTDQQITKRRNAADELAALPPPDVDEPMPAGHEQAPHAEKH